MKKRAFSLLLALLLLVSCCVPAFAASGRGTDASAGLTMVGHRGYSAIAPENTLAAFRLAGEAGFRGAECDVSRTVDGRWVVIHDDTVDRTTNGTGRVRDLTFEEIRALKIDGGNGLDRYPDEQVPTLEEFLAVCRRYGMRPFVEVKDANPVAEMDDLARVLRESGGDCVLISFGREHIAALHALLPENETYLLTRFPSADDVRFCKATGLTGVDLRYPAPFAEGVLRRAQAGGCLTAGELLRIADTLRIIRTVKEWQSRCSSVQTTLDSYFSGLISNKYLEEKITSAIISEEEISDKASPALSDIRRKMRTASSKAREVLDKIIHSSQYIKYLQDTIVTQRDGRYVVPVRAECRNNVPGLVHDTSSSGQTVFIEPMGVVQARAVRQRRRLCGHDYPQLSKLSAAQFHLCQGGACLPHARVQARPQRQGRCQPQAGAPSADRQGQGRPD